MNVREVPVTRTERAQTRKAPPSLIALVALLGMGCVGGFLRAMLVAPLHVPLDPNEGWNAYYAAAAMAVGTPYPSPNALMVNNYPPLSFYLTGLLGLWIDDNVVAGRVLSLAAFAGICAFVTIALRQMRAGWSSAAFAALLLAGTLLLTSDYVGMDDPQMLGHALQLAALLLVLRTPRSSASMFASACLFAAGGFVKHNLFALPIACVTWLVFADRRNAMRLALGLLSFCAAGLLTTRLVLGVNLLHQLNSARTYAFGQVGSGLLAWSPLAAFPLCGLAGLLIWRRNDSAALLSSIYAAIAVVSGAIFLGGAGVDVNAMFDADIALALCAGLAISQLLKATAPLFRPGGQVFACLCIMPIAIIALRESNWREWRFWLSPLREETALASRDISFLRSHAGPSMCENLTFCYWAGKPPSVDVFNLDQQIETGVRDAVPLLKLIGSRRFSAVELDETAPFPFPRRVESSFLYNYRIDHQNDEGTFFVPR